MLRLLSLKLARVYRCSKFLFIAALFAVLLLNTHNLLASFQRNELTDRRFIGLNKCPACFGTSWCRKFTNGQVTFETWGRLRFLDFFNVKNVYFAQYGEPREGTRRVVLKRLGSNAELAEIDQKICKRAMGRPRCDLVQAMYKTEFARLNGDVRLLTPEVVEGWSDMVHCPSQRLLDRVVRRYAETKDSGSFLLKNLKDTERMQLLMTLAFNPEPLVLQVCNLLGGFCLSCFPYLHCFLWVKKWTQARSGNQISPPGIQGKKVIICSCSACRSNNQRKKMNTTSFFVLVVPQCCSVQQLNHECTTNFKLDLVNKGIFLLTK